MKNKIILPLILLLTVLSIPTYTFGQDKSSLNEMSAKLDSYLTKTISEQGYVGLGACLIKDNKIQWMNTYGYANREEKKLLQTDDVFLLASLSKVFTTTAIMTLYEKGLFKLDDDINKYLPFKISNPNFPEKPITF